MKSNDEKKIKVLPGGPYEVIGNIPLNQLVYVGTDKGATTGYKEIQKYTVEGVYHLCRCGGSSNKPFCDGAHKKNGFKGNTTANHDSYDEMAVLYEGKVIDMMDAESLCAVARFCDTHGTAWKQVEEGDSKETIEIVKEQCTNCPSGRLTAVTKDGKRIEPDLPEGVSILEDVPASVHGPIWVKGGIPVGDEHGRVYPIRNRVTLCRCGLSENKPFCDGKHMRNQGELDD